MKKRVLALFLALCMALSPLSAAQAAETDAADTSEDVSASEGTGTESGIDEGITEENYGLLSTDDEEEMEADDSGDDGEDEDSEEPTEASWEYDEESKTLTINCYGDWVWAWFDYDWSDDDMLAAASEAETIVFNGYLRYLNGTMLAQFASLQTIELNCETYYQNYDDEGNMEDGWNEYYASNLWEEDGIIYFEDYGGDNLGWDTDDEGNGYYYIESNWYSRHFCWAGIGSDGVEVIEEITDVASYAFAGCSSDGVTVWFDGDAPGFSENAFAGASVTAFYCTDNNWSVEQWTNSYGSDDVTWASYGWNPSYVNAAASENELTLDGDSIEVELESGQDEGEKPYYAYYTITIDGTGFYNLYAYSESGSTYAYLYYGGNESEGDISWDCWNEGDRDDDGNASLVRMLYAGDTYYYVVRFDDYGSVEDAATITAGVTSFDMSGTVEADGEETGVYWTIDADGLLTLSGEGEVPDYYDDGIDSTPWGGYRDYITGLYISEGITYIGYRAFEDCYNLENIWFEGEPELSEYAFGVDGVINQWDERIVLYTGTYGGTLTYVAWDEDDGYGELNRGEYSEEIDLYDSEDENDYYVVEGENIVIVYITQSFLNSNYYSSRGDHGLTLVFNEVDEDGNVGDETKRYDLSRSNTVYSMEYDGHYYYLYALSDAESWEDAVAYCESVGGYLAAITSEEENTAVAEYIAAYGFEHTYIGFTDEETEGTWVWVNGEDTDYTNWNDGEPNGEESENYAFLYADGTWNDAVYAENGGSSEVFLCEWDSKEDVPEEILELLSSDETDSFSVYIDGCTYTYEYDDNGNLICEKYEEDDGYWYAYTYTYDSDGNMLTETYEDSDGNSWSYTYTHTYEYDESGNLIYEKGERSDGFWYTCTYTYDSAGNMTYYEYENSYGNSWSFTYTYEYDDNGNLVYEKVEKSDDYWYTYTYEYDSNGNRTYFGYEDSDGNSWSYTYSYEYDDSGNLIWKKCEGDYGYWYTCTYTYDTDENKVYLNYVDSYGDSWSESYDYYVDDSCDHSFESVVTEPTCTEQGYTTYTCSVCGDTYITDYVTATGHIYDGDYAWTWADDGLSAVKSATCTVCGEVDTEKAITAIWGSTRYTTANTVAEEAFPDGCTYAVIADGRNFPDALAAASLAGAVDGPVLVTNDNNAASTIEELEALGVTHVYIVGGTSSVSEAVEEAIEAAGITVAERLAGSSRVETALKVAEEVLELTADDPSDTCIISTSGNYPDVLCASAYSYWASAPIYFTNTSGTSLSSATLEAIKEGGYSNVVIVGGTDSVSEDVEDAIAALGVNVNRLGGDNRYATAVLIAEWSVEQGMSYDNAAVATGTNFPDALVASALCGQKGSVLLLSNPTASKNTTLTDVLTESADKISNIYVVGGESSVSTDVRKLIADALD